MEELWKDWPRQIARRTRKCIGLPASTHVGVISRILDQLLQLSSATQEFSLREIPLIISYPTIYGLYQEDITDAAAYLGVRPAYGQHQYQPRSLVAAYAGHSLGLCESYRNKEACRQEGLQMPVHETLLVEYTEHALLQNASVMREAHDLADRYVDLSPNFHFGSHNTPERDGAAEIGQAVLQLLPKKYRSTGPPKRIIAIITGGEVCEEVVEAVAEAIKTLGSEVEMLATEPEHIAVRGAAELAWRATQQNE